MKIKLISDLHLEFGVRLADVLVPNTEGIDVLVVAGDLTVGFGNVYNALRQAVDLGYEHIVYVPGNHEYYGTSVREFNDSLRAKLQDDDNIHFLHNDYVTINSTTFIGTPLWTNFQDDDLAAAVAGGCISDFRQIKNHKPKDCTELNNQATKYLKFSQTFLTGQNVIVTHFLPHPECTHAKYAKEGSINKYFTNDLDAFIATLPPTLWLFGHTHDSMDVTVHNTRMISNPYGYRGENPNFSRNKVIAL